jgi:hypothetical protein
MSDDATYPVVVVAFCAEQMPGCPDVVARGVDLGGEPMAQLVSRGAS